MPVFHRTNHTLKPDQVGNGGGWGEQKVGRYDTSRLTSGPVENRLGVSHEADKSGIKIC